MKRKALVIGLALAVTIAMCGMSVSAASKPGTPKITKASATQTTVTLTWSKAKKADGYRVYRYNGKKYVKIKTLKTKTYTVKNLKAYTTYKFKVRAYNKVKITSGKYKGKYKTYYGNLSKVKKVKTAAVPVPSAVASDAAIYNGSTATFECKAAAGGTMPYTYQWYKNGTAIIGATSETYTTDTLYTSDSGTKYTCRVTNPAGYIEATGTVTVATGNAAAKPSSVTVASQTVTKGKTATFTAAVTGGTAPLTYQWYKEGITSAGTSETSYTKIDGATGSTYEAKGIYLVNGTKFKCEVSNSAGTVESNEAALTSSVTNAWNIGASTSGVKYYGTEGTSSVVATLYSDGELAVTGSGDTVVFGTATKGTGYTWAAPWCTDTYKDTIKTSTIESTVGTTDMSYWYYGCRNLTGAPAIPSSVKDMTSTFHGCAKLTTAPTIPSGIENMNSTFNGCTALTAAPAIPSSVTYMVSTFDGCSALTTAPTIPSSVTGMGSTFEGCTALTGTMQINASPTSGSYYNCFTGASTNTGTSLKVYGLTANEQTVIDIVATKSTGSHITYYGHMVASWNIGSDTEKNNYNGSNGTDKVVATLYSDGELAVTGSGDTVVFGDATSGTDPWKAPWTTETYKAQVKTSTIAHTVKTTNMSYWYYGCRELTTAPTIPISVTDMSYTFENCTALTTASTIPSNAGDMVSTFANCTALTGAILIKTTAFSPASIAGCFNNAATSNGGTKLTVNYTSANASIIDNIIATKSASNITKAFTYVDVADQTESSGEVATFEADPGTSGTYTYQWYKNGTEIDGATQLSYTTPTLSVSDNGNIYRCVVKDNSTPAKEAYGEGTLTVTEP